MAPYTSKMCINLSKTGSSDNDVPGEQSVLYSLYGIVEHSGKLNFGHYTAYVKSRSKVNVANFLGNNRLCHLKKVMKSLNQNNIAFNANGHHEKIEENTNAEANLNKEDLCGKTNDDLSSNTSEDSSEKWYYISDSHVSEVSVAKVLKVQAYILFYERIK